MPMCENKNCERINGLFTWLETKDGSIFCDEKCLKEYEEYHHIKKQRKKTESEEKCM